MHNVVEVLSVSGSRGTFFVLFVVIELACAFVDGHKEWTSLSPCKVMHVMYVA